MSEQASSTQKTRSIVSIADLSKDEILELIRLAAYFEDHPNSKLLDGKIVATLFFEPSTRTRLSFETAVNRLGGRIIGFSDPAATSTSKGETLKDTIKMVANYVDLIVMRHYLEGAPRYASEVTEIPVINAGDGAHQHPSQTMLDLYSIYKTQGRLDDITVTMVGDLKYGRTVHSLLMALSHFRVKFNFVACEELRMPEEFRSFCERNGIQYRESSEFSPEIIADTDILYMTRVQRERFSDLMEYERVKDLYNLEASMLDVAKDNLRVLHPLPRVNEIAQDVDDSPKAYYFQQAKNGLFARQAMICTAMGIEIPDYVPIQGNKVVDRQPVQQPDEIIGRVTCDNPKCVTCNQPIPSRFEIVDRNDTTLRCHYCEHELHVDPTVLK